MEEGAVPLMGIVLFLFVLLVNVVFEGFSSALDNFNFAHLEQIKEQKKRERIQFFLEEDLCFKRTFQTVMSCSYILMGFVVAKRAALLIYEKVDATTYGVWFDVLVCILVVLCMVLILVVFGVFIPQKIASRKTVRFTNATIGFVWFFYKLFQPLIALMNGLANLIVPVFHVDPNQAIDDVSEEEIISMVNEGHEQGTILESEAEMIHNIFEFDDKDAQDIMTRRKNIVALENTMVFEEALDFMLGENYSRFPVYEDDIDHITGIIHIKDAMLLARKEDYLQKTIGEIPGLIRDALFIPETQNINVLFKTMQKNKVHMVVVVDEYGQTSGIAAMEDILEEIVGDIEDEHDEEVAMIIRQSNGSFLLNGMADLEDVEEALGIELDLPDIDTLNGLLVSLIDKIPEDNESFEVTYGGYLFRILSVGNKTIKTVLATKIDEPDKETT